MGKSFTAAVICLAILAGTGPLVAASKKETDCGHQAAVVSAIQRARLDRVREKKVKETILAGEVSWPARYNAAIPLFSAEIYKLKMRDLRKTDLGAQWKAACIAN